MLKKRAVLQCMPPNELALPVPAQPQRAGARSRPRHRVPDGGVRMHTLVLFVAHRHAGPLGCARVRGFWVPICVFCINLVRASRHRGSPSSLASPLAARDRSLQGPSLLLLNERSHIYTAAASRLPGCAAGGAAVACAASDRGWWVLLGGVPPGPERSRAVPSDPNKRDHPHLR